jgi:hypothetical protein
MTGEDLLAVAGLLVALGFVAWTFAELADRIQARITGNIGGTA